ncbi:hypothetical protein HNR42_003386 [Deinobacterium chartae]|uniref:Uncharacterized protein n=1 Tax=Deinobacterium chartae TaxID=521158 RepID=A0A841I4H4_9DEIO|nr:hypothetical protein [Deinobacterium chartae]MBB6099926.1 hypothetical protein [Deinobacterium chartae]
MRRAAQREHAQRVAGQQRGAALEAASGPLAAPGSFAQQPLERCLELGVQRVHPAGRLGFAGSETYDRQDGFPGLPRRVVPGSPCQIEQKGLETDAGRSGAAQACQRGTDATGKGPLGSGQKQP